MKGVPLYTDARHYSARGIPTVLYGAGPALDPRGERAWRERAHQAVGPEGRDAGDRGDAARPAGLKVARRSRRTPDAGRRRPAGAAARRSGSARAKRASVVDRVGERHGRARRFVDDQRLDGELAARQHVEAGQRVAEAAEIAAGHQHDRDVRARPSSRARCGARRAAP